MSRAAIYVLLLNVVALTNGPLPEPPAASPSAAPPASTAKPSETPNAGVESPLVSFQLSDAPTDTKIIEFADTLPKAQTQIAPIQIQNVLSAPPPADESPFVARIRTAYVQLYGLRLENEPKWTNGLNPMVWVIRTKGGAGDWWEWYKRQPAADRPIAEILPFVYDAPRAPAKGVSDTASRNRARQLTSQALDTLFGKGDFPYATELLGRAVAADPTYPISAYNAGVLQMVQHNQDASIRMFIQALNRGATPPISDRCNEYLDRMRKLVIMLLNDKGSQRRIYTEDIDAAWALASVGQNHAAAVFAGQARAIDRDEERPEADLVIAMICAQEKRPKTDIIRWLQYSLGRCTTNASRRIVNDVLKDVIGPTAPATNPAAANPTGESQPAGPTGPHASP
jgi:hypothetical protein